jgi:B9 domain-containing protein 2
MEVHVFGMLEGARDFENPTLSCKYVVEMGSTWRVLEGDTRGQSHYDNPQDRLNTVWSHPLDLHLAAKALQGWPKITLEVWSQDAFGRTELAGYGMVHVPSSPGTYRLEVPCWRPAGTLLEQFSQAFLGGSQKLRNENMISNPGDRFRLRTVSAGVVFLEIAVILKDFEAYGLNFN